MTTVLATGLLGSVAWGQAMDPRPNWDHDLNATELRNLDGYLDSHPFVASDLRRNPYLVDNPIYLGQHPGLRSFLATHPGVREEFRENPRRFMYREAQWDRREDWRDRNRWYGWRDRDRDRDGWRWRHDRDDWRDRDWRRDRHEWHERHERREEWREHRRHDRD